MTFVIYAKCERCGVFAPCNHSVWNPYAQAQAAGGGFGFVGGSLGERCTLYPPLGWAPSNGGVLCEPCGKVVADAVAAAMQMPAKGQP